MRLQWSVLALQDRNAIFDYIEQRDPAAAIRLDERIGQAVETLAEFPWSGRSGRVDGTRELVISRTPFIAAYCVLDDAVRVLRVLHGAQQWPDEV